MCKFCSPGSGSSRPKSLRIRIPNTAKKCNCDKYKNVWLPADQLSLLSPGWGAAFPDFSTPVLYSMDCYLSMHITYAWRLKISKQGPVDTKRENIVGWIRIMLTTKMLCLSHRLHMELDLQKKGSCVQLYSLVENPQLPPPRTWAHIRGRYWTAKIEDISL